MSGYKVIPKGYEPRRKSISKKEREFADYMLKGLSAVEAARKAFNWRCATHSVEAQKAKDLSRSKRVKEYLEKHRKQEQAESEATGLFTDTSKIQWDKIRKFAYDKLIELRDDPRKPSRNRWQATQALEKLADPTADVNLIFMWIDLLWRGANAHCPCCHKTFPLREIKNNQLNDFRNTMNFPPDKEVITLFDQRNEILRRADTRKKPHAAQAIALAAPERHIAGLGAARAGKCENFDSKMILSDGSVVKAGDLIDKEFKLMAFGPNGKQVEASAFAQSNGIKEVFKVTTLSGRSIEVTGNHPLLSCGKAIRGQGKRTQMGQSKWVQVQDLDKEDFILVPSKLNLKANLTEDEDKVKLLGYLLGDGGTTVGVCFSQLEGKVKEEFKKITDKFDCTTKNRGDGITLRVRGKVKGINPVLDLVRKWKINCKSKDKTFPDWAWKLKDEQLALLLNRLFACDGYATHHPEIGITLASEKMIRDIELACLRLGINGRVRSRTINLNKKGFKAYVFSISKKQDIIKFCEKVGIYGKELNIEKCLKAAYMREDRSDYRHTGCPEGYFWDEIKSIESIGLNETVAICVPGYETYVSTVVEHNSFLLSLFGLLTFLIPGAEVWILAETYKRASSEVEYLEQFLNTLFYPYKEHMVQKIYEAKTEELTLKSKWGSVLKVKSAKAKGSITGRELEMALVAEPGWVPEDVFEELRARMSSRLGRIIMLGTPKGYGGILGRMLHLVVKDPKTRKTTRIPPEERTIEAGCDWGVSLLKYSIEPTDNPEYVKSELDSARMELTDAEYASEFEGLMTSQDGALFSQVKPYHLAKIPRGMYENCVWVLGIDQGPKNFAGCLLGFDGKKVVVSREYFESDNRLMLNHMDDLRNMVPHWIKENGGNPDNWLLTIFDVDPSIHNELAQFESEGNPWPTDVTFRPKNKTGTGFTQENWRKETYEFVNSLAKDNLLFFDEDNGDQLHDQLLRAMIKPENRDTDSPKRSDKGWIISDPWRGDHVVDAFVLSLYTILSGELLIPDVLPSVGDTWNEARSAMKYRIAMEERRELAGFTGKNVSSDEIFENEFNRPRQRRTSFNIPNPGYYDDA